MNGNTPGNGSSSPFAPKQGFSMQNVPPQKIGPAVGPNAANPDSIPPGGRLPFRDPKNATDKTIAGNAQRKPFKLEGAPAPEAAPTAGPSDLPGGGAGSVGSVGEPELWGTSRLAVASSQGRLPQGMTFSLGYRLTWQSPLTRILRRFRLQQGRFPVTCKAPLPTPL